MSGMLSPARTVKLVSDEEENREKNYNICAISIIYTEFFCIEL